MTIIIMCVYGHLIPYIMLYNHHDGQLYVSYRVRIYTHYYNNIAGGGAQLVGKTMDAGWKNLKIKFPFQHR